MAPVAGIVSLALALFATAARLGERVRTRKWGWDDTWATICLAALIMFTFALFIFFGDVPLRLQGPLGVAIFYMVSTYFSYFSYGLRSCLQSNIPRVSSLPKLTNHYSLLKDSILLSGVRD